MLEAKPAHRAACPSLKPTSYPGARETHYLPPKGTGVCQPWATGGRGVVGAACGIMLAVWGVATYGRPAAAGGVATKLACCTGVCSPWVGGGTYWFPGRRIRGAIRPAGWIAAGTMAVGVMAAGGMTAGVMGLAPGTAVKPGLRQAAGDTKLPLLDVDVGVAGEPG